MTAETKINGLLIQIMNIFKGNDNKIHKNNKI